MDCAALKRKFDEAQAQTDETARVRVFCEQVALLGKLRVQAKLHVKRSKAVTGQHLTHRVNASAAHSQVDEILDHIAALSAATLILPH